MLFGEVAAPEIPALVSLLGAVVLVLAWLMASGALTVWRRSLGALLVYIADSIDSFAISIPHITKIKPLAPVAAALRWLNSAVDNRLGEAVRWSEKGAVVLFKFFTSLNVWMAHEIASLAHDTLSAVRGNAEAVEAKVKAWASAVYGATIHRLTVAVGTLTHVTVPGLRHRLDALAARVTHGAKALANSIAHTLPRVGNLEHGAARIRTRLTRIEKQLAAGLAAGFAVAILAKAVISWLRCPSMKRALTKRSCIDFDLLDALLTGTLLIVGTISLREFAKEVQGVTEEADGLIRGFLRDA